MQYLDFPDYQFVVAGAPSQEKYFYENLLKGYEDVRFIKVLPTGCCWNQKLPWLLRELPRLKLLYLKY
ncbi:MAG: hypothetical protein R2769_09340 [Saprospiraceae bacterium]